MNLRRRHKAHAEVYVHSLSDILFFLLFFFLLASILANPNVIKLPLPKATSNTTSKQTVVVSINAERHYFVATQEVPVEQLEEAIKPYLGNQTDPAIVINAEKTVPIEEVVRVLKVARNLNVKAVLATEHE
jgi:biopolymer transport protein ExbD